MKIIHLILGKANPDRMNGVNKVVHNLATEQHRLGVPVEVWGITPTPETPTPAREYNIRFFKSKFNKFNLDPNLLTAIQGENEQTRFHFHGGFITEFIPVGKALKKLRIPYIITPHGNYMKGAMTKNNLIKKIYFEFFEGPMVQGAQFVHCIGKGEIEDLHEMLPGIPVVLIPNGQRQEDLIFNFSKIEKNNDLAFGFCGRITRYQKGLDLLIEAFRKYKVEHNGIGELWLIGDGEYKEEIQNFIQQHNLELSIKLWGAKFGAEKLNIMSNMNAFYHPSRNEGLPTAVLEASALGIPLVVSQYTNMADYVDQYQAGITLPNNTVDEITNSMIAMAEKQKQCSLEQHGKSARLMAEKEFNWTTIAQRLIHAN